MFPELGLVGLGFPQDSLRISAFRRPRFRSIVPAFGAR